MRTRITFTHMDFEVTAQAFIMNSALVTRLDLHFHDIDEEDYPTGSTLEEIEDVANELLLEECNTPEVYF